MFLMFFGLFLMFLSQLGYCNFGLCFYLEINAVKKIIKFLINDSNLCSKLGNFKYFENPDKQKIIKSLIKNEKS